MLSNVGLVQVRLDGSIACEVIPLHDEAQIVSFRTSLSESTALPTASRRSAGIVDRPLVYAEDLDARAALPYQQGDFLTLGRLRGLHGRTDTLCTRSLLERIEEDLHGLAFRVGFTLRFIVSKDGTPLHQGGRRSYAAGQPGTINTLLSEVTGALQKMGVPVLAYRTEAGPGEVPSSPWYV